jgi:hypothetical protein
MYNYFFSFLFFACTILAAFAPVQQTMHFVSESHVDELTRQVYALRREISACAPLTKPALKVLQSVLSALNNPRLSPQDLQAIELHIRRFTKLSRLCSQTPHQQREIAAVTALIARRAALVAKLNSIKRDYLFTCVVGNNLPQVLERTLTHEEDLAYFNEQQGLIEEYKKEMDVILADLKTIEAFLLADTRTWWDRYKPFLTRLASIAGGVFIAGTIVNAFHAWRKK